jgi:hypothetical protein
MEDRNMGKETILYGVKKGDEDWEEAILCTQPKRFKEVKILAEKDGWGRFRVAVIDLDTPPDFGQTVRV